MTEKSKAVINTSPLIFLAKLDLLFLLEMYQIYSTKEIIEEVLIGLKKGYRDALIVEKLVKEGEIKLVKVKGDLRKYRNLGLHLGEITAILAAKKIDADMIIVDDYTAIKAAKYFGLNPMSTPFVMLQGVKNGTLAKKRFRSALDRLISFNYRISPSLYVKILELSEKLGRV